MPSEKLTALQRSELCSIMEMIRKALEADEIHNKATLADSPWVWLRGEGRKLEDIEEDLARQMAELGFRPQGQGIKVRLPPKGGRFAIQCTRSKAVLKLDITRDPDGRFLYASISISDYEVQDNSTIYPGETGLQELVNDLAGLGFLPGSNAGAS